MPTSQVHLGTDPRQQNAVWKLRVTPQLAAAATLEAEKRGQCRSEFIRAALVAAIEKAG